MSIGRHMSRIAVVKAIFAEEFRQQPREDVIKMVLEKYQPVEKDYKYIYETLEGVFSRLKNIQKILSSYAQERSINEINPTSRAILYLGIYELLYVNREEVPSVVAINESVEVARELSSETGVSFVNGVLNKVLQEFPEGASDK